jgi:hypothetical protein
MTEMINLGNKNIRRVTTNMLHVFSNVEEDMNMMGEQWKI